MTTATTPLVEVHNLSVEFRSAGDCVEAVKGVSFNIAKGEIVALVGESGSAGLRTRRASSTTSCCKSAKPKRCAW